MFIAKTPAFVRFLMPSLLWRMPAHERVIYLTFDDGPIPEVTPWVLETLKHFDAKATFFCVGDNVVKHPEVFKKVLAAGHQVGNHTFNHLNGWKNPTDAYLENVDRCSQVLPGNLFRPPYGVLKPAQKNALLPRYKIVMWDVLSGDFSNKLTPEMCFNHVVLNAEPGSIVLMHDSLKAEKNLRYVLPKTLEHFSRQGYRFETL
ncbi:MAG: polysaccharide deacetylase family protein [Saprospiraceae bacterium]|nr:polysaccharide deacetylase family protein [Saprospiraceae bacterium]